MEKLSCVVILFLLIGCTEEKKPSGMYYGSYITTADVNINCSLDFREKGDLIITKSIISTVMKPVVRERSSQLYNDINGNLTLSTSGGLDIQYESFREETRRDYYCRWTTKNGNVYAKCEREKHEDSKFVFDGNDLIWDYSDTRFSKR